MPSTPSVRLRTGPLAVLLTALALVLGALSAAPAAAATELTVSGTVSDAVSGPVSGATVSVLKRAVDGSYAAATPGAGSTSTTGTDGTYRLVLPEGTYKIKYAAPHYVDEWHSDAATEATADVTLTRANAPISGTVRSATATGPGISGVTVRVSRRAVTAHGITYTEVATRTSGPTGAFSVPVPWGEGYVVGFEAAEFVHEWYDDQATRADATAFSVPATGRTLSDVALAPRAAGATVSGMVRTLDGRPFNDATVTPYTFSVDAAGRQVWTAGTPTTTRDDGTYALRLAPGTYRVGFSRPDYTPTFVGGGQIPEEGTDLVVADKQDRAGVDARLALPGRVTGRLVNPDGTPYTGPATLSFLREVREKEYETNTVRTYWRDLQGAVTTDDNGYYEQVLPAGTYRTKAVLDGLGQGFLPGLVGLDRADGVTVAAEKVTAVPARTIATSLLSGSVRTPQGAGVPATVEAFYRLVTDIRDGVPVTTQVTDPVATADTRANGAWSVRVAHRSYRVRATGTSGGQAFSVYWPSAATLAAATDVPVSGPTSGVDFTVGRAQVQNTARPWISGGAKAGTAMTAHRGTWSPGTTLAVQWLADGSPISGATGDTYTPSVLTSGTRYSIQVTGTQAGLDPLTVTSQQTGPSASPLSDPAFENRLVPGVTGTPATGSTLTATNGEWSETPTGFTYQWTADNVNVAGATGKTFDPTEAQVGRRIAVKVTATSASGTATATSEATQPVARGVITNRVLPAVTGTAREGEKLTATGGTWSVENPTLAYQWLADGAAIGGATTSELVLGAAQVGKRVSVAVTATKDGLAPAAAESARTAAVVAGSAELVNTARPTITGSPVVGGQLRATPGSWTPSPTSFTYQWVAGGTPIAGATGATYAPTAADRGKRLAVVVTAKRAGHRDGTADSLQTAPVADGPVTVTSGPSVTGKARVGSRLTAAAGSFTPSDATTTYQWLRDGRAIAGATGSTYRVTTDDLGRRLGVQVTYSHPTREETQRTASLAALVKATPRLRLTTDADGRTAVLRLVVTATGADPTGRVRVLERGRVVASGVLRDGRVRLVVRKLADGMHAFTVKYAGDRLTASGSRTARVGIPG